MFIIGRLEQQAIDRLWQERTGLPLLLLMEAAASAVSRHCLKLLGAADISECQVLVLSGKGQNGGDALACARQLHAAGCRVTCCEVFPDEPLPPEAEANRQALHNLGLTQLLPTFDFFNSLPAGSLIIDGIFGTGYRAGRPLPPIVIEISRWSGDARKRGVRVVAIDVPSGLDADSGELAAGTLQADCTVTFVSPKIGLCATPGRFAAGEVIVDNIGVPQELVQAAIDKVTAGGQPATHLISADDIRLLGPSRPADSHKGTFGQVLFLGGAPGMPGAALLASEAAARSGAGLLTIAVPAAIGPLVLAARPEGLLHQLPADAEQSASLINSLMDRNPAVVAGPGAGPADWLRKALPSIIRRADRLVLDADALNLISTEPETYFPLLRERLEHDQAPTILTPHPGEFRRLLPGCSLADRQAAARSLAARTGCITVLKGASTVVALPDGNVWINPTGHNGLARGGSGDVLAGLIAGLLAQGLSPAAAATAGVYLHGLAADLAAIKLGRRAMLPTDVIASFGQAFDLAGWENIERSSILHGSSLS
jgi:ADP-dependent NAD(P)H-hydrate dehydratase / NAD(P)H-hydrate epimerase